MSQLSPAKQLTTLLTISFRQWQRNNGVKSLCIMTVCMVLFMWYNKSLSHNGNNFDSHLQVSLAIAIVSLIPYTFTLLDKRKPIAMDNFVRTRPISDRASNMLMLIDSVFSITNVIMILCGSNSILNSLTLGETILTMVLFFVAMGVSGIFKMLLKKSENSAYRTIIIVAIAAWTIATLIYSILFCAEFIHMPFTTHILIYTAACLVMGWILFEFGCTIKSYNDSAIKAPRVKSHRVSFFSMNFVMMLRLKTLISLIVNTVLLSSFLILLSYVLPSQSTATFCIVAMACCAMPLLMVGGSVLNIEANFIYGLWTRPGSIKKMLMAKYYAHAVVALASALIAIGICYGFGIVGIISLTTLVAMATYCIGFVNLLYFLTIFFSKRLVIFDKSFYKNNKADFSTFAALLLPVAPLALYYCAVRYLPIDVVNCLCGGAGLVCIILHRQIIGLLSNLYIKNRYTHFKRYKQ